MKSSKKDTERFIKITLERTMCYGHCPVYHVEIFSDGLVKYFGEMFVEITGEQQWQLDSKEVASLNRAIKYYDYFNIKKQECTQFATCHPSCKTSVLLENGKFRKFDNYKGDDIYPEALDKFEIRIDKIIGIEKYISKN